MRGAVTNGGPVFVVGMNGSGTTMLADCLGLHPQLYMFPHESKVLPYFLSRLGQAGDLSQAANRRRLADAIGKEKPYWHTNGETPVVLSDASLAGCRTFADVVSQIYLSFAARDRKFRWGDKSPANTHHISLLAAGFPDAQFVHIIRDGRDAAQSFHRRWRYSPRHTIWRWKRAVSDGRRQGATLPPERYLEVRYESLTSAPEPEMRRICSFLGLPFDAAVLQSAMRYMESEPDSAQAGQMVKNSGKWQSYFSAGQIRTLEMISGDLLDQLGYPVSHRGNAELSSVAQRTLRLRDGVAFTKYFFIKSGFKALPMYLRVIAAAAKQWSVTKH